MYVSHTVAWFIITEKAAYNVILAKEKMSYKSNISISVRKETGLLNKRTNTYKTEITNKGFIGSSDKVRGIPTQISTIHDRKRTVCP